MSDGPEQTRSQTGQSTAPSSAQAANEPESSSRRELIERYAKYAVIAAPLLVFVSTAQAIHSKHKVYELKRKLVRRKSDAPRP